MNRDMTGFNEWDFRAWLNREVGFTARKHYDPEEELLEELEARIEEEINNLSAMELVCHLGEYLNTLKD